jgi:hypothetical protein
LLSDENSQRSELILKYVIQARNSNPSPSSISPLKRENILALPFKGRVGVGMGAVGSLVQVS